MRDVSDARRQGDVDPSKTILADTRILEGNSAYGSTIMNQEKFQDVKYCDRHWFPRTCCEEHKNYDRRTPGLFKIEFEGDEIIGLCSKTYIVSKPILKKNHLHGLQRSEYSSAH